MSIIPVICVHAATIAQAHEKALKELWKNGIRIKTQYDGPEDPPSIDATANITIDDPLADPMIHKAFPGGIEDLREYVMELSGLKDHWVRNMNDADDKRWEYTYHSRFADWGSHYELVSGNRTIISPFDGEIDQIDIVAKKLAQCSYTRRAQMITWMPYMDNDIEDPPCFAAGTLVSTPSGPIRIEELRESDSVYVYDLSAGTYYINQVRKPFKKKSDCVKISTPHASAEVSEEQYMFTKDGWIMARDLQPGMEIRMPTICTGSDVSDSMFVGFMFGDGWLSSGFINRKNRKKPIKRCQVSCSIHPESNDLWIKEYFNYHSNNKVQIYEQRTNNKKYGICGVSKTVSITDRNLWEKLIDAGCPVGRKGGKVGWDMNGKSDADCKDFLTGIFSAEGSISWAASGNRPNISISMKWPEAIKLVRELLNKFNIQHKFYITSTNGLHQLQIMGHAAIEKALETFDFRLDSRKQAKFMLLKAKLMSSKMALFERASRVREARRLKKEGATQRKLRESIKGFYNRWLDESYVPSFRWQPIHADEQTHNSVWSPIISKIFTGSKDVYDFEVEHKDHAIIANGYVAHNCIQSLYFRITEEITEDMMTVWHLHTNVRIRSNDAWGASFMNLFGITMFVRDVIIPKINEYRDVPSEIYMARLNWQADSYHIYGKDISDFKKRFIDKIGIQPPEKRFYNFYDPLIQEIYSEAEEKVLKKIADYDATHPR